MLRAQQAPPIATIETTIPVQSTLNGFWRGVLKVGRSNLTLAFEFQDAGNNEWRGWLHSLDQNSLDLKISDIQFENGALTFKVPSVAGEFTGKMGEGRALTGVWKQGTAYPLTLASVPNVPELERPQNPQAPLPYLSTDITFRNEDAKTSLEGTLTRPTGDGPFPAVVLVQDMPPTEPKDRDNRQWGHRPYLVLADHLTRRGIAVLRFDARSEAKATLQTRQADVKAAVDYVRAQKSIDAARVGILGWGDGGNIASLVAAADAKVAFLVLMGAPGVTGAELMALQALSMPEVKAYAGRQLEAINDILEILETEENETTREQKLQQRVEKEIRSFFPRPEKPNEAMEKVIASMVNSQVKTMLQPWFRVVLSHDPRPVLSKVLCPVLAISGQHNTLIPARENLHGIRTALQQGGNKNVTVQELAGLNTLFQTADKGDMAEFSKIKETIAPSALDLVAEWIEKQTIAK